MIKTPVSQNKLLLRTQLFPPLKGSSYVSLTFRAWPLISDSSLEPVQRL